MTASATEDNTRLPRQVRERIERINAARESKPSGSVEAPPQADPTNPVATEPEAPTPASAPAVDPRENDPNYWRQRFNVTNGMIRTLREENAALTADSDRKLTELRDEIRALKTNAAPTNEATDVALFFTPEQVDQFGEEQCRAMANAALKAAQTQVQHVIDSEVKPIREKAQADAQKAQKDRAAQFMDKLAELVPDWEVVNTSQDWLDWLTEDDEASGVQRQEILNLHHGKLDAGRVAKVFKDFKASKARPNPPVAPTRSGGGQSEAPVANQSTKGYPTKVEMNEYFKRSKLGKVSDKERAEFESRLRSRAAA